MQANLREEKNTVAGSDDFIDMDDWSTEAAWTSTLYRVLEGPVSRLRGRGRGKVAIHTKDHVHEGAVVRVDKWAVGILCALGLRPSKQFVVPLAKLSGFREWKLFPRRKILNVEEHGPERIEIFECGHRRVREIHQLPTKSGHCRSCNPVDSPVIKHEIITVGTKD